MPIIQYLQLTSMKSLSNGMRSVQPKGEDTHSSKASMGSTRQRLQQLIEANSTCEATIMRLQREAIKLEAENRQLDEQLVSKREQLQMVRHDIQEQQSKQPEQDEQEMHNWISNMQKYSGLPQSAIDSLCCLEYEGGEEEICLSCYQPMQQGTMAKYLPCAHLFHADCINSHLKVNRLCPACGEEVSH